MWFPQMLQLSVDHVMEHSSLSSYSDLLIFFFNYINHDLKIVNIKFEI